MSERLYYLRQGTQPVACIAFQLTPNGESAIFGLSIRHSTKEPEFRRSAARKIALERLHGCPETVAVNNPSLFSAKSAIFRHLHATGKYRSKPLSKKFRRILLAWIADAVTKYTKKETPMET